MIHEILPVGLLQCNCSIVGDESSGEAIVIDPGDEIERVQEILTRHNLKAKYIVATHAHIDHVGGIEKLQRATGATVLMHRDDLPLYQNMAIQAALLGVRAPGAVKVDDLLKLGDVLRWGSLALEVMHTPGHSPDHVAFWHESSRTLFSGDLIVLGSSVMIHSSGGGDLAQYLSSLARLQALHPKRLLPAHGPSIDDPSRALAGYIEHRLQRERQVLAALSAGHSTVQAIAESIYDGLAPALMPAAQENVRAHLEKLKAEGRASYANERWGL